MNTMKYASLDLGTIEAVVNRLGGLEGVRRFLADELRLAVPQFALWRTVRIGVHKNIGAITAMLTKFKLGDWAKDILGKPAFTLAQAEEDVQLGVATVKELTGKNQATTTEIFDAIKVVGELCPAEVGSALREEYKDQPNGEWLVVAMEPIRDSRGYPSVFDVERDGGELWLSANYAGPDSVWHGSLRFVFRLRK